MSAINFLRKALRWVPCPPSMRPSRQTSTVATIWERTDSPSSMAIRKKSAAARPLAMRRRRKSCGTSPSSSPTCTSTLSRADPLRRSRDYELSDLVDRLLRFRQQLREHMPDVHHVVPDFEFHVHAGRLCALGHASSIVRQNFRIADMEQHRWYSAKIRVQRRDQRILR